MRRAVDRRRTAVWIRLAGGTALPYNFCWRLFEARLIGKLFIQRIEIALHTIRSIFRSRWVSGISDSISTKIIAICLLWCPIMLHPSYNYCTTERICTPLCQQVQILTAPCTVVKMQKAQPQRTSAAALRSIFKASASLNAILLSK